MIMNLILANEIFPCNQLPFVLTFDSHVIVVAYLASNGLTV